MIDNVLFISKKHWIRCFLLSLKTASLSVSLWKTIFVKNQLNLGQLGNFGKFWVTVSAIGSRNKMQDQMGEIAHHKGSQAEQKYINGYLLTNKFIKSYWLM